MNFKSLQSFFLTHRRMFFIVICTLVLFALCTIPAFAKSFGTTGSVPAQEGGGIVGFIGGTIAYMFYGLALGIGGMVAGLGGVLLDLSISHVVLDFGKNVGGDSGLGKGVRDLWVVVRDICNILFIFSLIYLGIKTILNSEDSETRKKLGLLIIAALLINFSLYISQVIIDFTNIIATQVFNQITSHRVVDINADSFTDALLKIGNNTVTGSFLDVAAITTFFGKIPDGISADKVLIFAIFMMIFLIIVGVVFAMGAFLLVTRFIALIIYMILSPLMFAGWIFPKFAQYQEKWWSGFLRQAFFAPAFLFMLYMSLVILQKMRAAFGVNGDAKFTDMVSDGTSMTPDIFTLVFFLIVAIGFLYASIKVGEMMSIAGSKGALKITSNTIGGMTAGLAARTGRATAGALGNTLAESKTLRNWASQSSIGRGVLAGSRYVGDANFDARSVGIGGKYIGEAKKGGYKTRMSETKKKDEEFAKTLGQIEEDDERVNLFMLEKEAMEHELHDLKDQKSSFKDHERETILETLKLERAKVLSDRNAELGALAVARQSIDKADTAALDANTEAQKEVQKKYDDMQTPINKEVKKVEEAKREFEAEKKKGFDESIKEKERQIKNQGEIINQEKNRRQTGGYVNAQTHPVTAKKFESAIGKLKAARIF